ncbi:hypothetical protein [Arthrobacter caoxuetaonis]|uniref:Uncharacterized protein n=1 Tax=Arthrobacter caoxuetaonis TaxID=2886935 RepID=A0A9X1MFZ8_9MICC|nr:hypothetical protein [Arthrobacter caoxuetaonis]MCC3299394.1 hypothetical protein [Arthrobacter caoxuetaonis]USQ59113.1 hypothetical protein NF551_18580 [Arthrobacter caoxuetaonis]
MNTILFTAASLAATIGLSLLVILPAGLPGRRRTLAALERAEAGATQFSDLAALMHGHEHWLFFMLRGSRERIGYQCERLLGDLGLSQEETGWGYSPDLISLRD